MNPSEKSAQANRLLNSKCHYEVLGVNKSANRKEIRKAFREMALKFHPDKNELPQAKDVFHKIVSAYEVLEDDSLKKEYDQKKSKPSQGNQQSKVFKNQFQSKKQNNPTFKASSKPSSYNRKFEEQFKRQFSRDRKRYSPVKEKREQQYYDNKNKSSPQRPTYRSQFIPQRHRQQSSRAKNCQFLLVIIVFIIIFSLSPFNNRKIQDRHLFSLTPTALHNIKMKTQKIKAPYYIKIMQNTNAQISQQLIERMYVRKLQKQCQAGLNQRESFQKMAAKSLINTVQSTYLNMAQRVDINPCKKIVKLLKKYPFIQLQIFPNNLQL